MHCLAQAAECRIAPEHPACRNFAQSDNQTRLNQVDLAIQESRARFCFLDCRCAVARRPAFDDVGDVDFLPACQSNRRQHIVEQLAGLADKRFATRIFFGTRAFTNNQPVGTLIADTKDRLFAPLVKRTRCAPGNRLTQLRPVHLLYRPGVYGLGHVQFIVWPRRPL